MSLKKTITRVERLSEVSFEEAVRLLEAYGYRATVTGSHHVFRQAERPTLTLKRRNPIHREAVKDLKRIVEMEKAQALGETPPPGKDQEK